MQKKTDFNNELSAYVDNILQNGYTYREVQQWLKNHKYPMEQFFKALTFKKYGDVDHVLYKFEVLEFYEGLKLQIEQDYKWSPVFHNACTPDATKLEEAFVAFKEYIEDNKEQFTPK